MRRTIRVLSGAPAVEDEGSSAGLGVSYLQRCPYYCLPIVSHSSPEISSAAGGEDDSTIDIPVPMVMRDPSSEESRVFSELADDVARQILRNQIESQMVPTALFGRLRAERY